LLQKRKSEKSLKSIYEKVQATNNNSSYVSEKYDSSSTRPSTEAKSRKTVTEESSTNLIGKVIS